MRRGGRRRPLDWVATAQTYQDNVASYQPSGTEERINYSLTTHIDFAQDPFVTAGANARSTPQLEQTVVRVKGQIVLVLAFDSAWWENANGILQVTHRIRVADQVPGTLDIQEPDLTNLTPDTMGSATFAQESFLWEHRTCWYNSTSWGDSQVEAQHQPKVIDVDITTKRRLEVGQSLALMTGVRVLQVDSIAIGQWPMLHEATYLRTLLRTIT